MDLLGTLQPQLKSQQEACFQHSVGKLNLCAPFLNPPMFSKSESQAGTLLPFPVVECRPCRWLHAEAWLRFCLLWNVSVYYRT